MTPFVPIMMFGWVPFTVFLFFTQQKPHMAVLLSVIGGVLFLPTTSYDWPGLPNYTKESAIVVALICGGLLSGAQQKAVFRFGRYDLPMLVWCLWPIASSFCNGLGLYDGISACLGYCFVWGMPYLAGRVYFNELSSLKDLGVGIIAGGVLYGFLCLYEIRMSPQLSNTFYGFFPHSFAQHVRYGGYRPIVFMQHGLMVSLWMAVSTVMAFWMWRDGMKYFKGIAMSFVVLFLMVVTILCKSSGAIFLMFLGFLVYFASCFFNFRKILLLLLLIVPSYIVFRASGLVSVDEIEMLANHFFNPERVESLSVRLSQEDLFAAKALEQPWFGWGMIGRGWPKDLDGRNLIRMIDPLWLIYLSVRGAGGLFFFLVAMLMGPYLHFRTYVNKNYKHKQLSLVPVALSLAVVLFMLDSLQNGMINIIYVMSSGALVSTYLSGREKEGILLQGEACADGRV